MNSSIGKGIIVQVNGKQYSVDSIGTKIDTNFPKFDTLIFKTPSPGADEPILCNFKPDSIYSVSLACCGSLDIIQKSKIEKDSLLFWDYDKDFEKIQNQLMDKPFISIKTKNKPKDSIYAWHADAACMTEHKVITTKPWRLGVPPKCYYWNNITSILFFTTNNKLPVHEETDMEEFLSIKNIVELASISFRLFDNERFVLIFDEKNNCIKLEYEK